MKEARYKRLHIMQSLDEPLKKTSMTKRNKVGIEGLNQKAHQVTL